MSSNENKPAGWFSRRHQSRVEHESARAAYLVNHGPQARRETAQANLEARAENTSQNQVTLLDARLGAGVGAKIERARLAALIEA